MHELEPTPAGGLPSDELGLPPGVAWADEVCLLACCDGNVKLPFVEPGAEHKLIETLDAVSVVLAVGQLLHRFNAEQLTLAFQALRRGAPLLLGLAWELGDFLR